MHGSRISKFTPLRVYLLCYSNCLNKTDPPQSRFQEKYTCELPKILYQASKLFVYFEIRDPCIGSAD